MPLTLIPRFAVIPSNGRPCLAQSVAAIKDQVDQVIIIQNGDKSLKWDDHDNIKVLWTDVSDNISLWWNLGLEYAENNRHTLESNLGLYATWDVAVINDDVIVPPGWFDRVSGIMRQMQVAAACSGGHEPQPRLHIRAGQVNLYTRMQGFAFILAGEKGLRADEALAWWTGDDDLDWRSRELGGMVMVPGFHVEHLYPNGQMTPERQVQVAKDMATFVEKWGMRPW